MRYEMKAKRTAAELVLGFSMLVLLLPILSCTYRPIVNTPEGREFDRAVAHSVGFNDLDVVDFTQSAKRFLDSRKIDPLNVDAMENLAFEHYFESNPSPGMREAHGATSYHSYGKEVQGNNPFARRRVYLFVFLIEDSGSGNSTKFLAKSYPPAFP